ncbi:putative phage protein [Bordetella avium 197N]|uniref:Phage protein n=1 Tax=Bordetella avium (strain 197N) TaxID=360910 RepID=Q2L2U4_BORA1|nr:putative phage protein [Bordetella avium 197N]
MAKYALVEPLGRVAQVGATPFPVAALFRWIECSDDVEAEWTYVAGTFRPPVKTQAQ